MLPVGQNLGVQVQFKFWCLALLTLLNGCLSETLIDNYDATKVTSGEGGASGTFDGMAGKSLEAHVPSYSVWMPSFVSAAGSAGSTNAVISGGATGAGSGGVAGTAAEGDGVAGAAGAAGESSGAGVAGAPPAGSTVPILLAVPNSKHSLVRYLAFDIVGVGGYGIKLGVTAADHVVAMVSAWGLAAGASLGGLGALGGPALLEVLPSGDPLRYVAFPGASMPDAFAIDLDGGIALAGRLGRDVSYGGPTISHIGYGYYVAALNADWVQRMGQGYATEAEATVHALALDVDGGIHVAISEASSYVLGLDTTGQPRFRWETTASPAAIAVDSVGRVHAVGALDGDGWLASYEVASGAVSSARRFGGGAADLATAVVVAPNGQLRVAGSVSGKSDVFGTAFTGSTLGTPFFCNLDEKGQVTWITLLGEAGTVATALQHGDRTYVAGHLYGPNVTRPWAGSRLYAAEIAPDGTVTSQFTIESSGDSATNIAVDSLGNIWLSGRADVVPSIGGAVTDSIVLLQLVRSRDAVPTAP